MQPASANRPTLSQNSSTWAFPFPLSRFQFRECVDILVVDDDETLRNLVKTFLELEGYSVRTAVDGINGLEMLERYRPKVVLTDFHMPRMNGVEFMRHLQLRADAGGIVPIFLTSDLSLQTTDFGLGDIPVVHKPFDFDHLCRIVALAITPQDHKRSNMVG